ncbi:glycerol-3-phosphate phosphatase-like protein [Saccharata proteae CBS 121410]|uniref:Glycerol-3-phosphate phosphatase-like protein n=1 Tax=Saccharata proteae CBS 121410 TaxID=1314787 RepID=A0A9P4HTU0_9PEZI|nr:glycerol-3-phosphate phosphatase-like protein [Saccharata proteae CBS 121410]
MREEPRFAAPAELHAFAGLLFDCDGTIIDSTDAIVKHWHKIGKELGVDPNAILATSHGRRSIDTLREYDPSLATWEYTSYIEGLIPKQFGQDAVEIPGARSLLSQLDEVGARWAIVTSGTRPLVSGWLEVMKLSKPENLVTAEDVQNGKPDPECYLLGCEKLGLRPEEPMLVLEDAPAGVRAGRAAGFKVVALATTHSVDQLKEAGAHWIVRDMRSVTLKAYDAQTGRISVEIANALQE